MGVLAASLARLILSTVYFIVSSAASIIIARRLPQLDYGVYYVAARRASMVIRAAVTILSYWYRRSADAEKVAEYTATTLLFTPVYYTLALVLLIAAGSPLHLALLYALYSTASGIALSLVGVYTAYRYVRSELLRIVYRIVFATLAAILVYAAGLGSPGVVAAQVAATSTLILLVVREVGVGRPRFETLRWERVRVPLLESMVTLLSGLTFIIASGMIGPRLMAIYAVAVLAPAIIVEMGRQAVSHTVAFIVKTGDVRSTLRAYKLLLLAAAPILGYIAAHPLLTVSLFNPRYAPAAQRYAILAAMLVAPLQLASIYAQMYTAAYGRETRETRRLLSYMVERLALQAGIFGAVVATITLYPDGILALLSSIAAGYTLSIVISSRYAEGVEKLAAYLLASIALTQASALYTRILYPDVLAPRFYTALERLAAGLPLLAPIYAALLLDGDYRLAASRLVSRLSRIAVKKSVGGFSAQPSA